MASKAKSAKPAKATKPAKPAKPARPIRPAKPVKKGPVAKKPVAAKARQVAAPPPMHEPCYCVELEVGPLRAVTMAGGGARSSQAFDSFDAVRMAAVERLVELIERCELRLHQLRRAASYEQFQSLLDE